MFPDMLRLANTGDITEMAAKLPRYVRAQGQFLFYQRDYPTRIRHLADRKTFTYPLKVKTGSHSSAELNRAIAKAAEAYELACKTIENSDPAAFSEAELDRAAAEFLRKRSLQPGQFVNVPLDPLTTESEQRLGKRIQPSEIGERVPV